MPVSGDDQAADPADERVLATRRRAARLAAWGKRVGYSLLVVAIIAFAIGLFVGFAAAGPIVIACLAATTVTLAPAIVVGYGVRAAEREDRQSGR